MGKGEGEGQRIEGIGEGGIFLLLSLIKTHITLYPITPLLGSLTFQ